MSAYQAFPPCLPSSFTSVFSSPDVRQHLWERVRHHPAALLRDGPLPHPDAESPGVHPLPPDPQPSPPEAGGVLSARLVLHQRHRHERREYLSPRYPCDQGGVPAVLTFLSDSERFKQIHQAPIHLH